MDIKSLLKMPGIEKTIMAQVPKVLEPVSDFIDKIKLQKNETYACLNIIKRDGELIAVLMTVDVQFLPCRFLLTEHVEGLFSNPEKFTEIEKKLKEKGVLKDE